MNQEETTIRVAALAGEILTAAGLELVDVEYRREQPGWVLRLFIDKPGGVTLDDCAVVSRELSAVLDVEDFIRERYHLEVSSPGLDRPLKSPADYQRFAGQLVKVRTLEPLPDEAGHKRRTFLGTLVGLQEAVVVLQLQEGPEARIPLDKVSKANLQFGF